MAEIGNNPFLAKIVLEAKTWPELTILQWRMNMINNGFQFNWSDISRDERGYFCDVLIDIRHHKIPDMELDIPKDLDEVVRGR